MTIVLENEGAYMLKCGLAFWLLCLEGGEDVRTSADWICAAETVEEVNAENLAECLELRSDSLCSLVKVSGRM